MTPVDEIILLNLENDHESLGGNTSSDDSSGGDLWIKINVRFASQKQFDMLEELDFDGIYCLFNECLPNGIITSDCPNWEGEQFGKDAIIHLDLSKTKIPGKIDPDLTKAAITVMKMEEITAQLKKKNKK